MICIYRCKDHLLAVEMADYLASLGFNAANMEYTKGIPSVRVCSESKADDDNIRRFGASESTIDVNDNLYDWAVDMLHDVEQIDDEINQTNDKKRGFMIGILYRVIVIVLAIFVFWPALVLSTILIWVLKGKESAAKYFGCVDSLIDGVIEKMDKNKEEK
jgi:tetrahydromethanopterin S-methyltransferase subunit G